MKSNQEFLDLTNEIKPYLNRLTYRVVVLTHGEREDVMQDLLLNAWIYYESDANNRSKNNLCQKLGWKAKDIIKEYYRQLYKEDKLNKYYVIEHRVEDKDHAEIIVLREYFNTLIKDFKTDLQVSIMRTLLEGYSYRVTAKLNRTSSTLVLETLRRAKRHNNKQEIVKHVCNKIFA